MYVAINRTPPPSYRLDILLTIIIDPPSSSLLMFRNILSCKDVVSISQHESITIKKSLKYIHREMCVCSIELLSSPEHNLLMYIYRHTLKRIRPIEEKSVAVFLTIFSLHFFALHALPIKNNVSH